MVVLHQLKLSIEEAHGPNNGHAEGGGENNFVEHLFLLVYDLGLRQSVNICSPCCKPEWSENRPLQPAGSNPLQRSRFQRKTPLNRRARGAGGKSIALQSISAIYTPKNAR